MGTSIDTIVANIGGTPGGAGVLATSGGSWGSSQFGTPEDIRFDQIIAGIGGDPDPQGTPGDDLVRGWFNADRIQGGAGNDTILGIGGNDVLNGGAGDDRIEGGDGNDWMTGGGGNDTQIGGNGDDIMMAGAGRQEMQGGAGSDTFLLDAGAFFWGAPGSHAVISGADGQNVADGINTVSLQLPNGVEIADILAGLTASAYGDAAGTLDYSVDGGEIRFASRGDIEINLGGSSIVMTEIDIIRLSVWA